MPMIRVTNNGISGVIDVTGKIDPNSTMPEFVAAVNNVTVKLPPTSSFYQQYPNLFIGLFALLAMLILFPSLFPLRKMLIPLK